MEPPEQTKLLLSNSTLATWSRSEPTLYKIHGISQLKKAKVEFKVALL